ncbi:MAG TPA: TPM domain-containing protein [Candidatus Limnocylindrales bacterium]|nr:TPM domain-containing protein [Candidatus Limnocylindrales bacterium]
MTRRRLATALAASVFVLLAGAGAVLAEPGPPFPEPEFNRAVYDTAGAFRPETVADLETTIDEIEARTGAEVVVYTQVWEFGTTEQQTLENALALMNAWGVGRRGIDDGLVILFDLDPSLVHGQVQLYAGSGFKSAFLTDAERQRIFEDDMLPRLRVGDMDGAVLIAMERIDAAATTEHSRELELARQVNAVVGLVGGSAALLGLLGWAVFHWLRFGRDPDYGDSDSIHVPAPPAGMTAASATMVLDGGVSRRTLTTALLDLASRGRVAFREEKGPLGIGRKLAIDVGEKAMAAASSDVAEDEASDGSAADEAQRDSIVAARLERTDRRPLGPAEAYLEKRLESIASGDSIDTDDVPKLAEDVPIFEGKVEDMAVRAKWFAEKPSKVVGRWRTRAVLEGVAGGLLMWAGFTIPASGLTLLGGAILVAGIVTLAMAGAMPARTMAGAMQKAWLQAYRRTLSKTMEQARSMDQVVRESGLSWLETPDMAVVWATALGLSDQVEDVLDRTVDDRKESGLRIGYLPTWYRSSDGTSLASGAGGGGGLFSGSGVPSIGGMMAAMGTIGNAPSSSGSGGGGFGGGGGGGGGGAGGGF